ncbi:MAG: eL32 family ribosomal protein [Candidatus Woesearchaeota archaeon]
MTTTKQLLEERKKVKKRKPSFLRADGHKKVKLAKKWREPRGLHNKMRLEKRGYRRVVKDGWGSPSAIRGMTQDGKVVKHVSTLKDLQVIDAKMQVVIIAGCVSIKNKIAIRDAALKLGITLLNAQGLDEKFKLVQERQKARKAKKVDKAKREKETEKKEAEKKEAEKKTSQKKESEKPVEEDPDEKKKLEKAEKDKLLTKRSQ